MTPSRRCGHLCATLHSYWFSGVMRRTMGVGDEYLVDLAHLHESRHSFGADDGWPLRNQKTRHRLVDVLRVQNGSL